MKEFYNSKNIFFLPEESRWSFIIANAKQSDIALKIDTALHTVEKNNPALKGALPDNYFSRLNMDVSKLSALLDWPFVDADDAIEHSARMTIPEIFERHGEDYFRDGERRVIARLIEEGGGHAVIATGGGAFVNGQTRALILDRRRMRA